MDSLFVVAKQFAPDCRITEIREFGNGNINSTFLVTLESGAEKYLILQRLNTEVFLRPDLVMQNMRISTEHIRRRLELHPLADGRRWEVPRVFLTSDAKDHWIDPEGSFWRALSFIEDAESFETIRDAGQAGEVGFALGMFQRLLSDLPAQRLADTLEGFHITPRYLQHYDEVLAKYTAGKSPELNFCLGFVSQRRAFARVLEDARGEGRLHLRPIHGDPKVNNILMDSATDKAVGMVDLDTIKPGLVHYDIGDCLRSGCNRAGEETEEWEDVRFDLDLCRAILQGYIPMAREFLMESDFAYLYDAVRLISFELGLRFFTDHLEGNVYFRIRHPEHNLLRALVQFRLCESIESQETVLRNIIREMR